MAAEPSRRTGHLWIHPKRPLNGSTHSGRDCLSLAPRSGRSRRSQTGVQQPQCVPRAIFPAGTFAIRVCSLKHPARTTLSALLWAIAEDYGEVVTLLGLVATFASGGCWLLSRQEFSRAAKLKAVRHLRLPTGRGHDSLFPRLLACLYVLTAQTRPCRGGNSSRGGSFDC